MTEGIASPLYTRWKGSLFPSYALRLALAYWDQAPSKAVVEEKQLRLRGESVPLWEGKMLVKFLRGHFALGGLAASGGEVVQPTRIGELSVYLWP